MKLAAYHNGNVSVTLHDDGTKVREYEGAPMPVHPESIDLKITDWCDGGCLFCHESSTAKGRHAEVRTVLGMIDGLPAGVELAIGGGDPLSHPQILTILRHVADQGLIANITVNGQHAFRHRDLIQGLRGNSLLHGLGVSFHKTMDSGVLDKNTIIHFIAGEHSPYDAMRTMRVHPKILVLGYKQFGRGLGHFSPRVVNILGAWGYWIMPIIRRGTVCFDNLALKQLNLKDRLPADLWDRCYMGDDGTFTMYADAVRDEFAISSTSLRQPRNNRTACQFFTEILH